MLRCVPNLSVDDLDDAIELYTALLNCTVVMNHGWIATLAPSADSPIQLSLMTADATGPHNPTFSAHVADIHSAHQHALDAGMRILHPLTEEPWGVTRFFAQDPHGNIINVLTHS